MFRTEEELVSKLIEHYSNKHFLMKEIGVGYGVSDLAIIHNKTELLRFIDTRKGLYLKSTDEIKIFEYIRKRNGVVLEELTEKHYISKAKMKYSILKNLAEVGAIKKVGDKYYRTPTFKLFSPRVTAIEAKLEDWNKGLAQAIRYQRFAEKSYLALEERYIHRAIHDEFVKYNVGLISVGSKVKEVIKPISKKPLDSVMRYMVAEEILARLHN